MSSKFNEALNNNESTNSNESNSLLADNSDTPEILEDKIITTLDDIFALEEELVMSLNRYM